MDGFFWGWDEDGWPSELRHNAPKAASNPAAEPDGPISGNKPPEVPGDPGIDVLRTLRAQMRLCSSRAGRLE